MLYLYSHHHYVTLTAANALMHQARVARSELNMEEQNLKLGGALPPAPTPPRPHNVTVGEVNFLCLTLERFVLFLYVGTLHVT